jgi:hypothetical protein
MGESAIFVIIYAVTRVTVLTRVIPLKYSPVIDHKCECFLFYKLNEPIAVAAQSKA